MINYFPLRIKRCRTTAGGRHCPFITERTSAFVRDENAPCAPAFLKRKRSAL